MSKRVSLLYLSKSFLKIGLTSFGGHAALVSVIQEEMVKKDGNVDEEDIIDGLSIASVLPGPLAVNVVTYIGYSLRGWPGAFTSMFSVLLPPSLLMILIAFLYEKYSNLDPVESFLTGVLPVIIGLILSLCYNMFRKHITLIWQYILFGVILIASFLVNSYTWILIYIAIGGLVGYFFKTDTRDKVDVKTAPLKHSNKHLAYGAVVVVLLFFGLLFTVPGVNRTLMTQFGKVSLTLFGGGYVMIPILHEIVVDQFKWLSSQEFANAIAFGQITPGPILITATYVGFRVSGLLGALVATIGIYVPSAVLMVVVGSAFRRVKSNTVVAGILRGIRPVIIALIAYSGWILFSTLEHQLSAFAITAVTFFIITFTRFNYFLLILIGGIVGLILF